MSSILGADVSKFHRALSELHAVDGAGLNQNGDYFNKIGMVIETWEKLPSSEQGDLAHLVSGLYFRRAQWLASQEEFEEASDDLLAEVEVQRRFGGHLEFSTKSPDGFFRELVVVHATVADGLGYDPLAGLVDYSFERGGGGGRFARIEKNTDIGGIEVPGLNDDERIATVHRVGRANEHLAILDTHWLVIPDGELPEVLEKATRSLSFDRDGKLEINLIAGGEIEMGVNNESLESEARVNGKDANVSVSQGAKKPLGESRVITKVEDRRSEIFLLSVGILAIFSLIGICMRVFVRKNAR
ncbi:MAG: hypothetical protein KDN05_02920 [Verrucomicrobiae bacterium]|nr:hypothetical protein [Verrucomicrobiae bacterium]